MTDTVEHIPMEQLKSRFVSRFRTRNDQQVADEFNGELDLLLDAARTAAKTDNAPSQTIQQAMGAVSAFVPTNRHFDAALWDLVLTVRRESRAEITARLRKLEDAIAEFCDAQTKLNSAPIEDFETAPVQWPRLRRAQLAFYGLIGLPIPRWAEKQAAELGFTPESSDDTRAMPQQKYIEQAKQQLIEHADRGFQSFDFVQGYVQYAETTSRTYRVHSATSILALAAFLEAQDTTK